MAPRPPGGADVAAAIAAYTPRSLCVEVAAFARAVVAAAEWRPRQDSNLRHRLRRAIWVVRTV